MDQTANEIETEIDRTRARLSSNFRELEARVDAATDWREHFRERPHLFLGAAFIGGLVLAGTLRPRPDGHSIRRAFHSGAGGREQLQTQVHELWNNVQGALAGLASARIREYIGGRLPGFDEHYRRAEQRAAAADPTSSSVGRTTG